jgi:hypothetical protein
MSSDVFRIRKEMWIFTVVAVGLSLITVVIGWRLENAHKKRPSKHIQPPSSYFIQP